jgi:hypothetical protein
VSDEEEPTAALGARRRANKVVGEYGHVFAYAYSTTISGGFDGVGRIDVQGWSGTTERARILLGVDQEPEDWHPFHRWYAYLPDQQVNVTFIERKPGVEIEGD